MLSLYLGELFGTRWLLRLAFDQVVWRHHHLLPNNHVTRSASGFVRWSPLNKGNNSYFTLIELPHLFEPPRKMLAAAQTFTFSDTKDDVMHSTVPFCNGLELRIQR